MNLNNWRNWGTNTLIRLGFRDQYAHAFAEQDYFVEDTEEEVSLAPTFLEFKIGKNWYKPWKWGGGGSKQSSPPPVDVEKIKRDAAAAAKKAADEVAAKNKAAYDKQQAEIKAMKDAEAKRAAEAAKAAAARQDKLTTSASALKIGGARGTTDVAGEKKKRKMGTGKTVKELNKKTVLNQAGGGAGSYTGDPVL